MTDIESTTVNEAGFQATSQVGDFNIDTDATGESGPDPNEVLVADYAACFSYAFRAGAQRNDFDELGKIQTDAEADLDDEDDLTAIRFTLHVEADLTNEEADELLGYAEDICHVHAALKESLYADVTVNAGAF
ncbi:OsmC family protein [Halobaculum sp. MBLA0147]|uniref:OsmC family protein n=1 Tax=Halobaculum sp. MBLA0147 TaxID=3079934 RepID=UPI0035261549